MGIEYNHNEYEKVLPRWKIVRDMTDSENLDEHIIEMNPLDTSNENKARNDEFKQRAVFAGISGRTARGLLGLIFEEPPAVELSPALSYMERNASGTGVGIMQQARDITFEVIRQGRCGLWVDFPNTDGKQVSKRDLELQKVFSVIHRIRAEDIVNWETVKIGAEVRLGLVVFKTTVRQSKDDDDYAKEVKDQRIELRLDENFNYQVRIWQKDKSKNEWRVIEQYWPTQGNGQYWDVIPFVFVGAEDNTWDIDHPPMHDISVLNAAHYNNSAIYEDSVFIVGQAQPWMSGLDQNMIDLWKKNNMYVGSGRLIGTPPGQRLEFAQAQENPLAKEAMDSKREHMVGLGALFVQPGSSVKTATQSRGEQKVDNSQLSLIAGNVSAAYTEALVHAANFMNDGTASTITLNQNYVENELDPAELREMTVAYLAGTIAPTAYFSFLKRKEIEADDRELEDWQEETANVAELTDLSMEAQRAGLGADDDENEDDDD